MHSLICFKAKKNDLLIQSSVKLGPTWIFEYQVIDPSHKILFQNISGRCDLIWQHTCFEAFVAKLGAENYFEFNFSPMDAWNVYEFKSHRIPQPPKESTFFELLKIEFKNNWLIAEVKPQLKFSKGEKFDVSLNAIIETKDGEKTYWSTFKFFNDPDFHLRESFNLKTEGL